MTLPTIAPRLHTYLCSIYPADADPESVATSAASGALARVRLRAHNAGFAASTAAHITGQIVHSVERIEPEPAEAAA